MSEGAAPGNPDGQGDDKASEPVVLPEHASVYYSPRLPPVATEHPTLEVAAVKLDASVDPRLADTHRVSVDGLEPPPWLATGRSAGADSPTVLLPAVRARRVRRRVVASVIAATTGAVAGVWFGLRDVDKPVESAPPAVPTVRAGAVPISTLAAPAPASAAARPSLPAMAPAPTDSPPPPVSAPPHPVSHKKTASSAWIHEDHPKAWLK